eukprot:gene357-202_t
MRLWCSTLCSATPTPEPVARVAATSAFHRCEQNKRDGGIDLATASVKVRSKAEAGSTYRESLGRFPRVGLWTRPHAFEPHLSGLALHHRFLAHQMPVVIYKKHVIMTWSGMPCYASHHLGSGKVLIATGASEARIPSTSSSLGHPRTTHLERPLLSAAGTNARRYGSGSGSMTASGASLLSEKGAHGYPRYSAPTALLEKSAIKRIGWLKSKRDSRGGTAGRHAFAHSAFQRPSKEKTHLHSMQHVIHEKEDDGSLTAKARSSWLARWVTFLSGRAGGLLLLVSDTGDILCSSCHQKDNLTRSCLALIHPFGCGGMGGGCFFQRMKPVCIIDIHQRNPELIIAAYVTRCGSGAPLSAPLLQHQSQWPAWQQHLPSTGARDGGIDLATASVKVRSKAEAGSTYRESLGRFPRVGLWTRPHAFEPHLSGLALHHRFLAHQMPVVIYKKHVIMTWSGMPCYASHHLGSGKVLIATRGASEARIPSTSSSLGHPRTTHLERPLLSAAGTNARRYGSGSGSMTASGASLLSEKGAHGYPRYSAPTALLEKSAIKRIGWLKSKRDSRGGTAGRHAFAHSAFQRPSKEKTHLHSMQHVIHEKEDDGSLTAKARSSWLARWVTFLSGRAGGLLLLVSDTGDILCSSCHQKDNLTRVMKRSFPRRSPVAKKSGTNHRGVCNKMRLWCSTLCSATPTPEPVARVAATSAFHRCEQNKRDGGIDLATASVKVRSKAEAGSTYRESLGRFPRVGLWTRPHAFEPHLSGLALHHRFLAHQMPVVIYKKHVIMTWSGMPCYASHHLGSGKVLIATGASEARIPSTSSLGHPRTTHLERPLLSAAGTNARRYGSGSGSMTASGASLLSEKGAHGYPRYSAPTALLEKKRDKTNRRGGTAGRHAFAHSAFQRPSKEKTHLHSMQHVIHEKEDDGSLTAKARSSWLARWVTFLSGRAGGLLLLVSDTGDILCSSCHQKDNLTRVMKRSFPRRSPVAKKSGTNHRGVCNKMRLWCSTLLRYSNTRASGPRGSNICLPPVRDGGIDLATASVKVRSKAEAGSTYRESLGRFPRVGLWTRPHAFEPHLSGLALHHRFLAHQMPVVIYKKHVIMTWSGMPCYASHHLGSGKVVQQSSKAAKHHSAAPRQQRSKGANPFNVFFFGHPRTTHLERPLSAAGTNARRYGSGSGSMTASGASLLSEKGAHGYPRYSAPTALLEKSAIKRIGWLKSKRDSRGGTAGRHAFAHSAFQRPSKEKTHLHSMQHVIHEKEDDGSLTAKARSSWLARWVTFLSGRAGGLLLLVSDTGDILCSSCHQKDNLTRVMKRSFPRRSPVAKKSGTNHRGVCNKMRLWCSTLLRYSNTRASGPRGSNICLPPVRDGGIDLATASVKVRSKAEAGSTYRESLGRFRVGLWTRPHAFEPHLSGLALHHRFLAHQMPVVKSMSS